MQLLASNIPVDWAFSNSKYDWASLVNQTDGDMISHFIAHFTVCAIKWQIKLNKAKPGLVDKTMAGSLVIAKMYRPCSKLPHFTLILQTLFQVTPLYPDFTDPVPSYPTLP